MEIGGRWVLGDFLANAFDDNCPSDVVFLEWANDYRHYLELRYKVEEAVATAAYCERRG